MILKHNKRSCGAGLGAGLISKLSPWGRLQTDDYDFRSWAKDASNKLLNAGCLYEYARESHQFRCLLSTGFVDLSWSGWQCWLKDFTDQLVANKSFAELLRISPIKVKESLDALVFQARCPIAS
jgi:hypothetical protein